VLIASSARLKTRLPYGGRLYPDLHSLPAHNMTQGVYKREENPGATVNGPCSKLILLNWRPWAVNRPFYLFGKDYI
jgi:hypothetical protein